MDVLSSAVTVLCGGAVGFALGVVGGGGSLLAIPLLIYVVGMAPHKAVGTSAVAVACNALLSFGSHARMGKVDWHNTLPFSVGGAVGAAVGSSIGKHVAAEPLLILLALVMAGVGVSLFRRSLRPTDHSQRVSVRNVTARATRVPLCGAGVGFVSGFFGIGGGFLAAPALMLATGMAAASAVASSLFAVGVFGLTTATNYAASGLIDWRVVVEYVAGGAVGGVLGMRLCLCLSTRRLLLDRLFAALLVGLATYIALEHVNS